MYEGLVLATRRVQAGQSELEFRIAPEPFRALFAKLRVTFTCTNGEELIGKASLSSLPFLFQGTPVRADQEVVFSDVRPGEAFLALEADGFEHFVQRVWVEPGSETDLGVVQVGRARSLRGFVQTADGVGVVQRVTCLPMGQTLESEIHANSNLGAGGFAFDNLGPHSYAVFVSGDKDGSLESSWGSPVQVIDLTKGTGQDVILTVQPTTTISLTRNTFDFDPIRVQLVDPYGVVRFQSILERWTKRTLQVAPGTYTLIVRDDEQERKRIVFELAARDLDFQLD